jgi:hypothetical protein
VAVDSVSVAVAGCQQQNVSCQSKAGIAIPDQFQSAHAAEFVSESLYDGGVCQLKKRLYAAMYFIVNNQYVACLHGRLSSFFVKLSVLTII